MTARRTPRVPIIGFASDQECAALSRASSCFVRPFVAFLISSSFTCGRNSCSGGSSRRTVTGRPDISFSSAAKSFFCTLRSSSRAAVSSAGVEARIILRTTGRRSGARNMCSVRHSPMPWAPSSRAFFASSSVSALARTSIFPLRTSSDHLRMVSNSFGGLEPASVSWPSMISPVVPSREIQSPCLTVTSPTANDLPEMRTASAPTTAGVPHPRATTAAWLTSPPREVRMPLATIIPWTSSGLVSLRTRMTSSPFFAAASASSAVK